MKPTIKIECYQCGETIEIPYCIGKDHAEYGKCQDCQEGVEVRFHAGVLNLIRLPEQYS